MSKDTNLVLVRALARHCKFGDIVKVKSLLSKYPTLDVFPEDKLEKYIAWPVKDGHWDIVQELLEYHIKYHLKSKSTDTDEFLHEQAVLGSIQTELEERADEALPEEIQAIFDDNLPVAPSTVSFDELKEYTYKGNNEAFITAFNRIRVEEPERVMSEGGDLLGFATTHECAGDIVDYLLDTVHVDVNHCDGRGRTALHFAVDRSNLDYIKKLVAHSVDPNIKDMFGATVMHYFAEGSNTPIETLELLLRAGGDLSITKNDGALPAHVAAGHSLDVLHAIVQADRAFDVNARDNDNDTLLHYAAKSETGTICTYLMLLGADATLTNKAGEVPAIVADGWDPSGVDNAAILGFDAGAYPDGAEGFYEHTVEPAGASAASDVEV